jgi:hypothetical protein
MRSTEDEAIVIQLQIDIQIPQSAVKSQENLW